MAYRADLSDKERAVSVGNSKRPVTRRRRCHHNLRHRLALNLQEKEKEKREVLCEKTS